MLMAQESTRLAALRDGIMLLARPVVVIYMVLC
jgi:hypothetical protein